MLLVFDFDGPLFDAIKPRDCALQKTAARFGEPTHDLAGAPLYEPTGAIRLAYAGSGLSEERLTEIETFYRQALLDEEAREKPDPRAVEAFERISRLDVRLAVLSMRTASAVRSLLTQIDLARYFSGHVWGRDTLTAPKPDRRALLDIIEKMGTTAGETLFIGDTALDLKTARDAGVAYLHAAWSGAPNTSDYDRAAAPLGSLAELEIVLRNEKRSARSDQSLRTSLREAVRKLPFSFFAGAGVSVGSNLGDWNTLYRPILERFCTSRLMERSDLPDVLQLIASNGDDASEMFDAFRDVFKNAELEPGCYHMSMVRSRSKTIWTTNYDDLFERAQKASAVALEVIKNDRNLKEHFGEERLLIKANGDFADASYKRDSMDWGVILTDEQFDLAETYRAEIWRYFEDEYRTSSMIFVGVSFADPILKRIVSNISRKLMRTKRPHYVLTVAPTNVVDRFAFIRTRERLQKHNIHTVEFANFAELQSFVVALCYLSSRPVVAFSGTTAHFDVASKTASVNPAEMLQNGSLSSQQVAAVCQLLGRELARSGFRIISGHGAGVGIPAVAEAFVADPSSARFLMRAQGATSVSREAPAFYVRDDKYPPDSLVPLQRTLIGSAHVLVVVAGTGDDPQKSVTTVEATQALESGKPILVLPQSGGAAYYLSQSLEETVTKRVLNEKLRIAVLKWNREIASLSGDNFQDRIPSLVCEAVQDLVNIQICDSRSRIFDDSLKTAARIWTY